MFEVIHCTTQFYSTFQSWTVFILLHHVHGFYINCIIILIPIYSLLINVNVLLPLVRPEEKDTPLCPREPKDNLEPPIRGSPAG